MRLRLGFGLFAILAVPSLFTLAGCGSTGTEAGADEADVSTGAAATGDGGEDDLASDAVDPDKKKDAGVDAGKDAGKDSGVDAGKDAGKDSGTDGGTSTGPTGDAGPFSNHVRLVGANISTGNDQSYDPGEGIRILQGLKPDVTMLQEVNYGDNTDATIRGFVDKTFGTEFSYYRETGAQIPNAIISRYPILTAGTWVDPAVANRTFVYARLDLPGEHELYAVSVHLLTTSAGNRATEAAALVKLLKANVPAGDYMTVGGDFNTATRNEAAITDFGAIFDVAAPYPADQMGNSDTSEARSKPHDWVLVDPTFTKLQVPTVIGTNSAASGLVFDTRVFTPLTAAAPAEAGDSAANGMQHMPVVKDFEL